MKVRVAAAAAAFVVLAMSAPMAVAKSTCQNTGNFDRWLDGFKQKAVAAGIDKGVADAALRGVQFNPGIIKKDRAQVIFSDDWLTFAGKLVSANRLKVGAAKLQQNKKMFDAIEKKLG